LIQKRDEKQLDIDTEAKLGEATDTTGRMNRAEKRDAITDGFWSTAGTILAGAATGAAIGAFFGPVGAAIGAGIGTLVASVGLIAGPSEEEVEEEQTGGLSHDEFNKLAAEMQARGVSKDDKEGI
jgi:phage tail tape-measure protein